MDKEAPSHWRKEDPSVRLF